MDWELALICLKLACGFVLPALFLKGACDFPWLLHVPISYSGRTFSLFVRAVWMVAVVLVLYLLATNRVSQTGYPCFGWKAAR